MQHLTEIEAEMRRAALARPETREDHPWGESAFKVRQRTFLFMSPWQDGLNLTMKLPRSFEFAVERPFARPAGYNLSRGRWVTCRFLPVDEVPLDLLIAWLEESYRAVAPKTLLAAIDGGAKAKRPG